jgi:tetratricopeptide (TPR) repeat protein
MEMINRTIKAFFRFVRMPTWDEGRQVVEEYQDELLDTTLEFFTGMIGQAASDDPEASRVFAIHQEVLRRCRDGGIDAGFDATLLPDPKPQLPDDFDLSSRMEAHQKQLLQVMGPLSGMMMPLIERMFEQSPDTMLNAMMPGLQDMLEQWQQQPGKAPPVSLEESAALFHSQPELKELLDSAISQSSDLEDLESVQDSILDVIQEFVDAESWEESYAYLEQHTDILLTLDAETQLSHLIQQQQHKGEMISVFLLERHRNLLRRCREIGVDLAFAELIGNSPDIPIILHNALREARDTERLYLQTPDPLLLDQAIDAWEQVLQHAVFARISALISNEIFDAATQLIATRYHRGSSMPEDMDRLITLQRLRISQTASESTDLPVLLYDLADSLHIRYDGSSQAEDLEEVIDCYRQAITILPSDDSPQTAFRYLLGKALHERYSHSQQIDDLSDAIACYRQTLAEMPDDSSGLEDVYQALGSSLSERFAITMQEEDMEEATLYFRRAQR